MHRAGIKQGPEEELLSVGNHSTLGRERIAPWRSMVALVKAAKGWNEYTAITDSALPTWNPATQIETDPLAGVTGADDAGDDVEYPVPLLATASSPYTPMSSEKYRQMRQAESDSEDSGQTSSKKKKRQRRAPTRKDRLTVAREESLGEYQSGGGDTAGDIEHVDGPGPSSELSPV